MPSSEQGRIFMPSLRLHYAETVSQKIEVLVRIPEKLAKNLAGPGQKSSVDIDDV
jgi:hypothetical protein